MIRLHRSGLNTLPTILNKCSTGADKAGISKTDLDISAKCWKLSSILLQYSCLFNTISAASA